MSPISFCLYSTKLFFTLLVRKNLYLKFLYNKFFSIYNYLFRFFCLFGFQWTVSRTLCTLVGPSGLEPPLKLISRYAREKPLTLLKGSRSYLDLLVGPSGLEPPTSCLSGTRSNLLSYEPMWLKCVVRTLRFWWRWWDSFSRELRARSSAALTVINCHSLPLPFESVKILISPNHISC